MDRKSTRNRQKEIISKLLRDREVFVADLANEFSVSATTIRTDLDILERRGFVVRTHGGAVQPENLSNARLFARTINENREAKENIALKAKTLVNDGDTIIIDAGSTQAILAEKIRNMNLTVITNSLPVIEELKDCENIRLIIFGGIMRRPSVSFIGGFDNCLLESINIDKYFMGATSYSYDKGISCSNIMEGQTKQKMIESSSIVIFSSDSSKAGKSSLFSICRWNKIDYFVSDSISVDDKKNLEKQDVKVLITEE